MFDLSRKTLTEKRSCALFSVLVVIDIGESVIISSLIALIEIFIFVFVVLILFVRESVAYPVRIVLVV